MFFSGGKQIYETSFVILLLRRGIRGSGREIPRVGIRVLIVSEAKATAVNVLVETLINPQTELLEILRQHQLSPAAILPDRGSQIFLNLKLNMCVRLLKRR